MSSGGPASDQRPWINGFRDLYPADSYGISDGEDGASNGEFFQTIINTIVAQGQPYAQGTGSGRIYFPFYTGNPVFLTGTIQIGNQATAGPDCNVWISGSRAQLLSKTDDTDCFLINNHGGAAISGALAIVEEFRIGGGPNGNGNGFGNGIAIHTVAGIEHLIRHNYIQGFGGISVQNGLGERIVWNTIYQKNATSAYAIYVGASSGASPRTNQAYCIGNITLGGGNGTAGYIIGSSVEVRHLCGNAQGWPNAMLVTPDGTSASYNIFKFSVTDYTLDAQLDALVITTSPTGAWINAGVFHGINSQAGKGGNGSGAKLTLGAGSATQTPNTQISGITFSSCDFWNATKAGYEFNTGSQIRIIGGQASSNTNAGVWCNGPIADLMAIGVDLSAKYQLGTSNQAQSNAILIDNSLTAGTAGVLVFLGCPMNGYGSFNSLVNVVAAPTSLRIGFSPGYNDQKHAISTANVTAGTTAAANGYYGFSRYEWNGNTGTITVNAGIVHTEASGSLWLDPYDTLKATVAPTNSSWTGY